MRKTYQNNLNDDGIFNFIYSIQMKDYIIKTMRSLRAEGNIAEILSIVNLKVFRLFIYLFERMRGGLERIAKEHIFKEMKISH